MISAPASASATAMAWPMPRLQPVTRAIVPSSLNWSRTVNGAPVPLSAGARYQHLHDVAAAFHFPEAGFQLFPRNGWSRGDPAAANLCLVSSGCYRNVAYADFFFPLVIHRLHVVLTKVLKRVCR